MGAVSEPDVILKLLPLKLIYFRVKNPRGFNSNINFPAEPIIIKATREAGRAGSILIGRGIGEDGGEILVISLLPFCKFVAKIVFCDEKRIEEGREIFIRMC